MQKNFEWNFFNLDEYFLSNAPNYAVFWQKCGFYKITENLKMEFRGGYLKFQGGRG